MAIRFKNYNFDKTEVTALATDTNNGEFLWIAFSKDITTGTCTLRKVSAHNLNQIFYTIELAVDKISRLKVHDTSIYLAVEHSTIMGYKILVTNPLTSQTVITRPVSIIENPVDIAVGDTYLYYLFPGDLSGENAKIVKIDTDGDIEETIDLAVTAEIITEARGITFENDTLWIVTHTDPVELVRVYQISGGIWEFSVTTIGT